MVAASRDEDENDSADEALMEMLGLVSPSALNNAREDDSNVKKSIDEMIEKIDDNSTAAIHLLREEYKQRSVVKFPNKFSVPSELISRWTNELVWSNKAQVDKTYENIKVLVDGEIQHRRKLTRLENFVNHHSEWNKLCRQYLPQLLSRLFGETYVLFKEKLNMKPQGGAGFAPHLDGPSLRVALGDRGPRTFVTVMVAIDRMTASNGCLRLHPGPWTPENCATTVQPAKDGNPDADGRAGAIPLDVADDMEFEDLACEPGTIAVFGAWTPHRSAANQSPFPRRAVFLTYNPLREGDFHDEYYEEMNRLRNEWRNRVGLSNRNVGEDERFELDALSTIPKI